jgi:hypothetical protein
MHVSFGGRTSDPLLSDTRAFIFEVPAHMMQLDVPENESSEEEAKNSLAIRHRSVRSCAEQCSRFRCQICIDRV